LYSSCVYPSMNENNIQLIKELYAAFSRGDISAILNVLADNVEWVDPGAPDIPYAGVRHGRTSVADFFSILSDATEVLKFEPREYLESGDTVIALGYWQARAKNTGRSFESDWAMAWRVKDGKVERFQAYVDTLTEAKAFANSATMAA